MDGVRCVILRNQDTDMVRGLVFQTGMLREQFQRYGDSLVLDWTHNTNNLGFYLGSLLATSASGKGVPVLDFLCISQGTALLTSVLEFFVKGNPGAVEKVRSVVIDKDLAEWAAINTVFTSASVVLCQFHVVKWFNQCVTNTAYNIEPENRPGMILILRAMVDASTEKEFKRLKGVLRRTLNKEHHAPFHMYMKRRWYSMKEQWTDFKRGKVYTAGNTTSNRLESHWNQLKAGLGKKRRIDSCFLAIVMRGRAVLGREYDELVEFAGETRLLRSVESFIQPIVLDLSSLRVALVRQQWEKYLSHPGWYSAQQKTEDVYNVSLAPLDGVLKVVTTTPWSCTCRFAVTHGLPCRHQLYVAQGAFEPRQFPASPLPQRWQMSVSSELIKPLQSAVEALVAVRISTLASVGLDAMTRPSTQSSAPDDRPITCVGSRPRPVSYIRFRRDERSEALVMDALQKRNHTKGQLDRVLQPMMLLSTARFWEFSTNLENLLTAFLESMAATEPKPPDLPVGGSPPASTGDVRSLTAPASPRCKVDGGGEMTTVPTEIAGTQLDASLVARLASGDCDEDSEIEFPGLAVTPSDACDDDENADEEDFACVCPSPTSTTRDGIPHFLDTDVRPLFDSQVSSLHISQDTALQDCQFASFPNSECGCVRFPDLPDDGIAERLDALLHDTDREDDQLVVESADVGFVEGVASAVWASLVIVHRSYYMTRLSSH